MNAVQVANNLVILRQSKGLTQEGLSKLLHVSRQAISKWETGMSLPNLDMLLKLSKLYQISMNEILESCVRKKLNNFEEIINIDSIQLKMLLKSFDTSEIIKASMGASPQVHILLKQLYPDLDFVKEMNEIGRVRISEIEDIHTRIVHEINNGSTPSFP